MAIKKVGGSAPIAAPQSVDHSDTAVSGGFGELKKVTATNIGPKDEVIQAVHHVAEKVAAGRLSDPQAQVDAVIERMVELQAPDGVSVKVVRERVSEVQLALGDHPGFASRVQAMLARALQPPQT